MCKMVDKVVDKECDEFINKLEKSLNNDLLKLDSVNTITDLSDCVNIVKGATMVGGIVLPVFGSFFGAVFSDSMCSKNAQKAINISNKLNNINEYKKIRDHFELGNSLPTDHYINKKDNRELFSFVFSFIHLLQTADLLYISLRDLVCSFPQLQTYTIFVSRFKFISLYKLISTLHSSLSIMTCNNSLL